MFYLEFKLFNYKTAVRKEAVYWFLPIIKSFLTFQVVSHQKG